MNAPGPDWYPIRIFRENARWLVDWCRFDGIVFDDPFFHESVQRALDRPFNRALRRVTPLDEPAAPTSVEATPLAPNGFVFHLSRCGSTLVSQAFAALSQCIAISEAGAIDEILRAERHDANADEEWRIARLREVIALFGRRRRGDERAFVVKLDAWHVHDLALIERAFPGVPWVFVMREPAEVMVSHAQRPGWIMSAVNAPTLLHLMPADAMRIPRADYHARALARMCDAVLAHESDRGVLVDYDELPEAIVERIAPAFSIDLSAEDRASIERACALDVKNRGQRFTPDVEAKRAAVDDAIASAANRYVNASYRLLRERAVATGCSA